MKRVLVEIDLPDELHEAIEALAKIDGKSFSVEVRELISIGLKQMDAEEIALAARERLPKSQ